MMVEGKKLSKALTALDGLIYDLKVTPVRNAMVSKKGHIQEKHPAKGVTAAVCELVKAASDAGKLVITTSELSSQMKGVGYHPQNAQVGIKQLIDRGALTKQSRGIYTINTANLTKGMQLG